MIIPTDLRQQIVLAVIENHPDLPLTVEALAEHFAKYDKFDLGQDDLDWYAAALEADQAQAAEPAEPDEQPEPEPPASANDIEAAVARKLNADQALANARVALQVAQRREVELRGRLSTAVASFQRGFAPVTQEQLHRDFLASEAALRVARKEGRAPPRHTGRGIGPSAVDRSAYYQRFGHGAAAGGGRAYAGRSVTGVDGSFIKPAPSQVRLMPFSRPKVPSER